MVAESSIPVLVGDVVDGVGAAIWTDVRVGSLDNIIMRSLHTIFQSTDSISCLESAAEGIIRLDDLLAIGSWTGKFLPFQASEWEQKDDAAQNCPSEGTAAGHTHT